MKRTIIIIIWILVSYVKQISFEYVHEKLNKRLNELLPS